MVIKCTVYSELRNNMQVSNYQFTDATLSNASPFEILEAFHKKISDAMPEKVKAPLYGAKVFQQDPFQEIMTTLESAVTELLLDFQERKKK